MRATIGAARGQHLRSARSIAADDRRSAPSRNQVVGHADAQAAQIAVQRRLVVRHRLARTGGVARIVAGDHARMRAQSRAVRASGPTLSCENDSGIAP